MMTGVFGGSFNPIHNAHIALGRHLLKETGLDEIWFVVSPQNPLKQQEGLMPDDFRMEMARKALKNEDGLKACDYEMHLPKPSYMWVTLQNMSRDWPDREFALIIGSDNWLDFSRWHRAGDIIRHYRIIIYPRPGYPVDKAALPATVTLADTPFIDISSTEIRRRMSAGEDYSQLVPPVVAKMLEENRERL